MKIQAAFNAAFGESVTIFAAQIHHKIVIAKVSAYTEVRKDDVIFLSNNPLVEADFHFEMRDFQAAFEAYQILMQSNKCVMQDDLARYKPENVVDFDGQKDNGDGKYNIDKLKNGHWAVLAICLYYFNQTKTTQQFDNAINFMNDLIDFYLTI